MNAVTPAIRASLLSDAAKGASLRRWSIRDLLGFNLTSGGRNDDDAEGVESLLREVQIRLAVQHSKLSSFSVSIGGDDGRCANGAASGVGRRSVRDADSRAAARACLRSLMQLHESTYVLPHRIVDGDWRGLLEGFGKGPNRRYVSGVFDEIMSRHGSAVETFADAVTHARGGGTERHHRGGEVPHFLRNESIESFLHSRLLIQLLCEHYVYLGKGRRTGAISLGADVAGAIDGAATEARHVCDANLGVAPDVRVRPPGDGAAAAGAGGRDFRPPPIIPSWLHHAMVEVTKNAMASSVRRFRSARSGMSAPPGVHISFGTVTMADGGGGGGSTDDSDRYLRIQITDRGIGLEDEEEAFGFARSSSRKRWDRLQEQQSYAAVRQPLGSLGVGLPLSRLMLRVFGGDLDLSNNNCIGEGGIGGGCTATLTISYDDTHVAEN
jgi:pyruvate dehydrogenase kinase 2/3/4